MYLASEENAEDDKHFLNKDHTHFILVGEENAPWGSEIRFRSELEDRYFVSGVPVLVVGE